MCSKTSSDKPGTVPIFAPGTVPIFAERKWDCPLWFTATGFTLALSILLFAGCNPGEPRGRVFGKVTFQGQPVPEGIILFSPVGVGDYMTAKLKPDGTYEVSTNSGPGLRLGKYRVSINPPLVDAPMGPALEPPKLKEFPNIPEKYRKPETSGLTLSVQKAENPFDVDMQP